MTEKIDYKKTLAPYYAVSSKEPAILEIPGFNFLMIDGHGDPNSSKEYKDAVSALFTLAYALKFHVKKTLGIDYGVMPLEGLWWSEDMKTFVQGSKDAWIWTMMILQPKWIDVEMVNRLQDETFRKKGLPALKQIRFESYAEGISVQMMHIGPFATEGPNIERMHRYAHENGFERAGKHHEIYLNDFTRIAPEKMRTILRQPLQKPTQE